MDCSPPAPLSMEFSRQESWSGLPFPFPGDLPDPVSNPGLLHWQVGSLPAAPFHCWERNHTIASGRMDLASLASDPLRAMLDGVCVLSTVSPGAQGLLAVLQPMRPAGQGRLPRGEKPWTGALWLQNGRAPGLPAGVSLLASPIQEEHVRRKKREERLQQIRHSAKLRFVAKRTVSVVPGTMSRRRLPVQLVRVSSQALGPLPGTGAA